MTPPLKKLKLFIDGAARGNPGPAAVGVVLADSTGRTVKELSRSLGTATNNVAEFVALILGLQEALHLGARELSVFSDSELLVRQINGRYRIKDETLQWLHVVIRHLVEGLKRFEITHIPREKNAKADRLAARAVLEGARRKHPKGTLASPPSGTNQPTFW